MSGWRNEKKRSRKYKSVIHSRGANKERVCFEQGTLTINERWRSQQNKWNVKAEAARHRKNIQEREKFKRPLKRGRDIDIIRHTQDR